MYYVIVTATKSRKGGGYYFLKRSRQGDMNSNKISHCLTVNSPRTPFVQRSLTVKLFVPERDQKESEWGVRGKSKLGWKLYFKPLFGECFQRYSRDQS